MARGAAAAGLPRGGGAVSERDFQRGIIDLAERLGFDVKHFHDSRREVRPGVLVGDRRAAGWPDLALISEAQRRLVLVELKSRRGRLRPDQRRCIDLLLAAGCEVHVWREGVDTFEAVAAILRTPVGGRSSVAAAQ
jgi:hypothetical protein